VLFIAIINIFYLTLLVKALSPPSWGGAREGIYNNPLPLAPSLREGE